MPQKHWLFFVIQCSEKFPKSLISLVFPGYYTTKAGRRASWRLGVPLFSAIVRLDEIQGEAKRKSHGTTMALEKRESLEYSI